MASVYQDYLNMANDLIAYWGVTGLTTFTRKSDPSYNTSTLDGTPGTPVTYNVKTAQADFGVNEINGVTITANMKRIYLAANSVDSVNGVYIPIVGDEVALNGVTYRILEIQNYTIQGNQVAYLIKIGA